MKILLLIILITFASFTAKAQETLLNDDIETTTYISLEGKFTNNIDGEFGFLAGGKMAVIFNKTWGLGFAGCGLMNNNKFIHENLPTNQDFRMDFVYIGSFLEYIYEPDDLIHFNVNCLFGIGGTTISADNDCKYPDETSYGTESCGIIEPGIQLEINFFSWMKVGLGGSYRYLYEYEDFYDFVKSDFEGLSGVLTFTYIYNSK